MASELTEFKAEFEGEQANTAAKLTELREVVAGVEQSTATQLTQLQTEFKEGDRQTNAAVQTVASAVASPGWRGGGGRKEKELPYFFTFTSMPWRESAFTAQSIAS